MHFQGPSHFDQMDNFVVPKKHGIYIRGFINEFDAGGFLVQRFTLYPY